MTGPGRLHPEDGEPGPISPSFGPLSTSPEPTPDLQDLSEKKQLSLQTTGSMSSSQQRLSDAGSSEFDYMARSPLLEHEHGSLGLSGLQRIRTLPSNSSPSLTAQRSQRSASNLSLGTMTGPVGATSPQLEDLHRFPTESLHSFSFAQQSDELIHSRHNILKRSIDFMRDRFGLTTSNDASEHMQERGSEDTGIDSVVDLVSKAHLDQTQHARFRRGPLTGPADLDRYDPFDKAFSEHSNRYAPREHSPSNEVAIQETSESGQYLSPISGPHTAVRRKSLKSAPTSRRVSLKRTFTDVGPVSLRERLSVALSQPYSATDLTSAFGLNGGYRAVHTHSSKWSPVAQAVFRTESKPGWTIIAANDLACLVFGVTQAEVKKLSILDLVQKERREWLESRLRDPNTEQQPKQNSPAKQAPLNPRSLGMGNGVTAQLLSKPPSRERTSRRSQTENGSGSSYNRPRQAKSPNHSSNKSRGVLLCGDVVPIQKRNGATGSASLWVMEKRGGLIWVVEEVVENFAQLKFDDEGRLLEAESDVQSIWERKPVRVGMPISELLPKVTIPRTEKSGKGDVSFKASKLKYFTASASGDISLPVTVTELSSPRELRVSHFPHVAGMMVLSPTTLKVISANPVFCATLFGQENPRGSHITNLIPEFDKYLVILTEEDNIEMVDGVVVSEHSFRRARALSVVKEGKVSAASIFLRPAGLPARHRDGGEIMVDVQMRIVKSETIFPESLQHHVGGQSESGSDEEGQPVAVTEVVYALWIMYSRQLHSAIQQDSLLAFPETEQTEAPPPQASPGQPSPILSPSQAPTQVDLSTTESKAKLSLLSQQLNEAASEPLTDKPAQPVSPVNMSGLKKEAPKKRTISDYVILEEMGQGAYGQVKLARCKRNPSKKVVLKYVTKKRILVDTWTRDRRLGTVPLEIHVLDYLRRDGLRHPNIVEMEGFFEDDVNYYIEMLPHGLPGMDLFDYIELQSNMDEGECRSIFMQVVDAIHHLHTKALVVHRDIKDENVVLDGEGQIKLIDFGSAAYIKNGPFDVFVGTIDYAAPEVLQGKPYKGKEQDVWALGILLYTIVYKENPFYNIDEILDHPLRVPYLPFSEDCIDLIRRMLDRDVDQRLSITQVLEHPWMMAAD